MQLQVLHKASSSARKHGSALVAAAAGDGGESTRPPCEAAQDDVSIKVEAQLEARRSG
jgi:hypothetical protein